MAHSKFSRSLFLSGLIFASTLATAADPQPQRVRVILGSHLPQATEETITYSASCGSTQYQLKVVPTKGTVTLSRSDGPDVNLSTTTVGRRLVEEDVLIDVGFNCPLDALNIFLKGVKLLDQGAPSGFRDHVTIRSNGDVSAGSPRVERLDELAIPRTVGLAPAP